MVIVFAVFAIFIGWLQSKHREGEFQKIVKEQSIHWCTSLLVVGGVFLLQNSGHLSAQGAGLVIQLILSLATMLDGLRIGWRFSLVGLFLGLSSITSAFFEVYIAIDLVLVILIIAATFCWEFWINKRETYE